MNPNFDGEKTVLEESTGAFSALYSHKKGGAILDTYTVEEGPIETGGMGLVWRVHHTGWNVDLAMKQPRAEFFTTEKNKEIFINECTKWIDLGLHPNIVSCYYVREIGGIPTIFAEWMEGGSLADWIRDGRLYAGTEQEQQERILDIAIQFARGLHYAHELKDENGDKIGLLHRDVKPGNLLFTKDGEAKVSDFGLAQARALLTMPEGKVGIPTEFADSEQTLFLASPLFTPVYCSIEQMDGKNLTRQTDIYSWAVSVLEMYVGSHPWASGVVAGTNCQGYFNETRVPMPEQMKELLAVCLESEPENRLRDFGVVLELLAVIYTAVTGSNYPRPESNAAKNTADYLNNKALSFVDLGMCDEAERCWKLAQKADPNNTFCVYNHSLYLWRMGIISDEEAIGYLKTKANFNGNDFCSCLAWLHIERAMPEEAIEVFLKSNQFPNNNLLSEAISRISTIKRITSPYTDAQFIANNQLLAVIDGSLHILDTVTEEFVKVDYFPKDLKITHFRYNANRQRIAGYVNGQLRFNNNALNFIGYDIVVFDIEEKITTKVYIPHQLGDFVHQNSKSDHELVRPSEKTSLLDVYFSEETNQLCALVQHSYHSMRDQITYTQNYFHCWDAQTLEYLEGKIFEDSDISIRPTPERLENPFYKVCKNKLLCIDSNRCLCTFDGSILSISPDGALALVSEGMSYYGVYAKQSNQILVRLLRDLPPAPYMVSKIAPLGDIRNMEEQSRRHEQTFFKSMENTDIPKALQAFYDYRSIFDNKFSPLSTEMECAIGRYCRKVSVYSISPASPIKQPKCAEIFDLHKMTPLTINRKLQKKWEKFKKLKERYQFTIKWDVLSKRQPFALSNILAADGIYEVYAVQGLKKISDDEKWVLIVDQDQAVGIIREDAHGFWLCRDVQGYMFIAPFWGEYATNTALRNSQAETTEVLEKSTSFSNVFRLVGFSPDSQFVALFSVTDIHSETGILMLANLKKPDEQKIIEKVVWKGYRFSEDGRYICADDFTLCWQISYNYEFPGFTDWDEDALPYLEAFLHRCPNWTDIDFEKFITELQNRDMGYIRPEGVRAKLSELTQKKKKGFWSIFGNKN